MFTRQVTVQDFKTGSSSVVWTLPLIQAPTSVLSHVYLCAQNPDGSLKDAKDIQWFHDEDDVQLLPLDLSIATPVPAAQPVQPLRHGLCNKTADRASGWSSDEFPSILLCVCSKTPSVLLLSTLIVERH